MPQLEANALTTIIHNLPSIEKSLALIAQEMMKANKLKAIELKAKNYGSLTPEMIDEIEG